MATKDLEPTADGSTSDPTVTYVGSPNNFNNVKKPDNDATNYVNLTDNPATQSWWIDKLNGAATVDANPTVTGRCRKDTTGFSAGFTHGVRLSGSTTLDGFVEPGDNTWFTDTTAGLARPGGGSWGPNDFPGGTAGTEVQAGPTAGNTGTNHNWSTIFATVTYTPTAGGFYYLLGCWLPPLLAVASHGLSLSEIASFLCARDPNARTGYRFKVRPGGPNMRCELDMVRRLYLVRPRFAF